MKKLKLNKEIVSLLNVNDTKNIKGGEQSGHPSCNPTCARSCNQSCEACNSVIVNKTCPPTPEV